MPDADHYVFVAPGRDFYQNDGVQRQSRRRRDGPPALGHPCRTAPSNTPSRQPSSGDGSAARRRSCTPEPLSPPHPAKTAAHTLALQYTFVPSAAPGDGSAAPKNPRPATDQRRAGRAATRADQPSLVPRRPASTASAAQGRRSPARAFSRPRRRISGAEEPAPCDGSAARRQSRHPCRSALPRASPSRIHRLCGPRPSLSGSCLQPPTATDQRRRRTRALRRSAPRVRCIRR